MDSKTDVADGFSACGCSTHDLLERLEAKAIRIAELESQVAALQSQLRDLPARIERRVVESMANAAVNCGASSSCAVARWRLEAIEKRSA